MACLFPRISIPNVVASVTIHDENMKPLWKVVNIYTYAHKNKHIHIHMYKHIYISIYTHIHKYTCMYIYTCMYMCVCVCVRVWEREGREGRVVVVGRWMGGLVSMCWCVCVCVCCVCCPSR